MCIFVFFMEFLFLANLARLSGKNVSEMTTPGGSRKLQNSEFV